MPDWTAPMKEDFEYYTVDPLTWRLKSRLTNVQSCSIDRDLEKDTLGSASFTVTETLGEDYIRVYLVTTQNGIKEKTCLGTFLVQTPSSKHDSKIRTVTMDAYTPLIELKENQPPLGYFTPKETNIMDEASRLTDSLMRAPVVEASSDDKIYKDFVANSDDTWITYLSDMIANAKFRFDLDEECRVLFAPIQDANALQAVWTYTDDNTSIVYPEVTMNHDLYGIPNTVEVVYSDDEDTFYGYATNDDVNSPLSTVNRGRTITKRVENPTFQGKPNAEMVQLYAEDYLKSASTIEYSVTYKHGYCPVRVGDCVRLNFRNAGLMDIRARVTSQSITCDLGCAVSETATWSRKLWR